MKMNLSQIKKIIDQNKNFLKSNYGVKNIGVFGSVVRSEDTKKSDVDLLVEFSKPVGFFKFIELEEFLGKKIKRKVDLVTKKAIKASVKEEILREVVYV